MDDARTPTSSAWVDRFEAALAEPVASAATVGGDRLAALRRAGRTRFRDLGFPTRRVEAWKYTSLAELADTPHLPAPVGPDGDDGVSAPPVPPPVLGAIEGAAPAARLVLVNGRVDAALSSIGPLPDGVVAGSLAAALRDTPALVADRLGAAAAIDDGALIALNTAFFDDGVVVIVPPGVELAAPVELTLIGRAGEAPLAWHPRLILAVGAGSRVTVVEHHLGGGRYFSNLVTEVAVGAGARLGHYRVQAEAAAAAHVSTITARLERDAVYETLTLSGGARVARNEVRAVVAGTGAECRLYGAYLARGRQILDNTTVIDHAVPGTRSRQVFQGAIDDQARGVFQGKVVVRPDAQKTDGYQLNRALLLSERAEIDSKPELEIFADDVKCSHGATAGEIDDSQLFYLQSRGIGRDEARGLLTRAFLGEVIAEIEDERVRAALGDLVGAWMDRP